MSPLDGHGQDVDVLNSDLRKISVAPDELIDHDSLRGHGSKTLGQRVVVQLVRWKNVSAPSSYKAATSDLSKDRIISVQLTDGVNEYQALDLTSCLDPSLLVPGVKLQLEPSCRSRYDMLLLEPSCCRILGGRVDALAEAYKADLMFGAGAGDRPKQTTAPKFSHFDPNRRIVPPVLKKYETEPVPEAGGTKHTGEGKNNQTRAHHLLDKMQERSTGPRGRGGRRGRRRFERDEEEDEKRMTVEEWEARKKSGDDQEDSDYRLAQALQQQLDMEAMQEQAARRGEIELGFRYGGVGDPEDQVHAQRGDGRGGRRGRGRGGRHGGRRGRGRGGSRD